MVNISVHIEVSRGPKESDLIKEFMLCNGFKRTIAGLYIGDKTIDADQCVLTVRELVKKYDWFTDSVIGVNMLVNKDNTDLLPLIKEPTKYVTITSDEQYNGYVDRLAYLCSFYQTASKESDLIDRLTEEWEDKTPMSIS